MVVVTIVRKFTNNSAVENKLFPDEAESPWGLNYVHSLIEFFFLGICMCTSLITFLSGPNQQPVTI